MKLVVAVIHEKDQRHVQDSLLESGFQFTNVASTGGFLREGNVTLMIGVDEDQIDPLIAVIRESCQTREQYVNVMPPTMEPVGTVIPSPVKVVVGGAIVFVLDVERFEKI
ncbi:MAG TPA: cyclic-di-AMP receptor [Armatimonadota bacterium]